MKTKSNYSQKCISKALVRLLQKYPIDQITISKLVEEAKVSRGAFYNNYKNLEDVLISSYQNAHSIAFENKSKDINYLFSEQYIIDMIDFFDQNSDLLLAIYKWNLLDFIPKQKTKDDVLRASKFDDPVISKHSLYFTCFSSIRYFTIGIAWIISGKQESSEQLFKIIKYFNDLEKNSWN